jgi:hypothetical protein
MIKCPIQRLGHSSNLFIITIASHNMPSNSKLVLTHGNSCMHECNHSTLGTLKNGGIARFGYPIYSSHSPSTHYIFPYLKRAQPLSHFVHLCPHYTWPLFNCARPLFNRVISWPDCTYPLLNFSLYPFLSHFHHAQAV